VKLVLDTNVVLSALLWGGSPEDLLLVGRGDSVTFVTSPPLMAELRGILSRRKFEKKIAASLLSVDQIVELYSDQTMSVQPFSTPRIVSDPDDDVVIGTAIAARADLIVTGDKALLSVAEYQGVRIVSVADALRILTSG
jgi:putative PIN family toxin of toxin-antitoxin system